MIGWDQYSRSFDAVGPVPAEHFKPGSFTRSIDNHLLKQGLDRVVVDMTGMKASHIASVRQHIELLPSAFQERIIRIGF